MNWRTTRRALSALLLMLSVGYVVWRIATDSEAVELLRTIPVWSAVALVVIQLVYLLPQGYRYLLALRTAADRPIPALGWLRLFVIGRFLNLVVPQAGTVYRGHRLREDYHIPVTRYLGGFVAFTWLSTIVNLSVASLVIGIVEPGLRIGEVAALAVTAGALAAVWLGPPCALWLVRRLRLTKGFWGWAKRRLEELLSSSLALLRSGWVFVEFILVGLAGLGLALASFWVAFNALDLEVSVSTTLVFFVLLQLSTYLTITPGNLGVFELGFGALGAQLGIGLIGGLLVATLLRVSGYLALLVAGLGLGGGQVIRQTRYLEFAGSDPAIDEEVRPRDER